MTIGDKTTIDVGKATVDNLMVNKDKSICCAKTESSTVASPSVRPLIVPRYMPPHTRQFYPSCSTDSVTNASTKRLSLLELSIDKPLTGVTYTKKVPIDLERYGEHKAHVTKSSLSSVAATSRFPFNPIGRLLGPQGMTLKQLDEVLECRITVRGRGSVKDAHKEMCLRDRRGWEHLHEPLHVHIAATRATRAQAMDVVHRAEGYINELLKPVAFDNLKRRQLIELAVINGNYRPRLPKQKMEWVPSRTGDENDSEDTALK